MSYAFPPGIAETMSRAEIDIVYSEFPEDTHDLVGRMLDGSEDRIVAVHFEIDAPALAVQAVATHVGGWLPTYDHVAFPDTTETGRTRRIAREDMFAIAEGPAIIDIPNRQLFRTILERAAGPKPAEEAVAGTAGRIKALLHRTPAVR